MDLDCLGGDRSLKLLRGTHGDVLRWRGGVAMRALLSYSLSNSPDPRTDWRPAGNFEKAIRAIQLKVKEPDNIPAEEPIDARKVLEIVGEHLNLLELFPEEEKARHREDVALNGITGRPFDTSYAVGIAGGVAQGFNKIDIELCKSGSGIENKHATSALLSDTAENNLDDRNVPCAIKGYLTHGSIRIRDGENTTPSGIRGGPTYRMAESSGTGSRRHC